MLWTENSDGTFIKLFFIDNPLYNYLQTSEKLVLFLQRVHVAGFSLNSNIVCFNQMGLVIHEILAKVFFIVLTNLLLTKRLKKSHFDLFIVIYLLFVHLVVNFLLNILKYCLFLRLSL